MRRAVCAVIIALLTAIYLDSLVPQSVTDYRWRAVILHFVFSTLRSSLEWFGPSVGLAPYHIYRIVPFTPQLETETVKAVDGLIENVPVRTYYPKVPKTQSILVYYHGGGYASGSLDSYHPAVSDLTVETGMKIIAVGYRLVPEHKTPAAIEDCMLVTKHVLNHPDVYGYEPGSLFIAGDSAGGHIAATISQSLTDEVPEKYSLAGVILIYPVVQMASFILPSYRTESFGLLPIKLMSQFRALYFDLPESLYPIIQQSSHLCLDEDVEKIFDTFLNPNDLPRVSKYNDLPPPTGNPHRQCNRTLHQSLKSHVLSPKNSPLFKADLKGLPRTLVLITESDILRDEGILYHQRLVNSSVPSKMITYPGGLHGMFSPLGPIVQPSVYYKIIDDIRLFIQG